MPNFGEMLSERLAREQRARASAGRIGSMVPEKLLSSARALPEPPTNSEGDGQSTEPRRDEPLNLMRDRREDQR